MREYVLAPRQLDALRNQAVVEALPKANPVMQMLGFAKWWGGIKLFYLPPSSESEAEFLRVARAAGFEPAKVRE
jgi:hypothetical protein